MKQRLILSSIVLILLTFGFNGLFNYTTIDEYSLEVMSERYGVFLEDFKRHVENGQHFGKQISNFEGINRLLADVRTRVIAMHIGDDSENPMNRDAFAGADIHFSLIGKDKRIFATTDQKRVGDPAPTDVKIEFNDIAFQQVGSQDRAYTSNQDRFIVTEPLYDSKGQWSATMLLDVPSFHIKNTRDRLVESLLLPFTLIVTVSAIFLVLLLSFSQVQDPNQIGKVKKRAIAYIFIVFCTGQLMCSGLFTLKLIDSFAQNIRQDNRLVATGVRDDIRRFLNTGIGIERLNGMDGYIQTVLHDTKQADSLQVKITWAKEIAGAVRNEDVSPALSWFDKLWQRYVLTSKATVEPLLTGEFPQAIIEVIPSMNYFHDQIGAIFLDSITIFVISMLLFGELLLLAITLSQVSSRKDKKSHSTLIHYSVMRPAAFLFLFGIDISISFLPLHMERLSASLWGLSRDVIMGIPISVEFLFVGISILLAGVWLDRRGWHEPFISGVLLSAIGGLYSWIAPDALHFILSRAVVGIGYGLALMASQGFVITFSDSQSKARGLASLFAGIYAGSICGGATGGMLADRLSYESVFLCGAVILFGVALYVIVFMRGSFHKPQPQVVIQPKPDIKRVRQGRPLFNFIFNRSVLGLVLFSSLPASIAAVGFLNYFSPIYLNRLGVSQSNIGRVLMIYGICMIYLGPFISRYVDSSIRKKYYIFFGCILGCSAFLMFQVFQGIVAATVSVGLLGLSNCFILASQSAYALKLDVTSELGEGKAIGIFRSTSRLGQMLGPIMFGWVIVSTNITQGITYIGMAYFVTALLFLIIAQNDRKFAMA